MSVGEYIYKNLGQIIEYCNQVPDELNNLLDIKKSKELFNLNYAFFIETKNINENDNKKSPARYIRDSYKINDKEVRITNDWYPRNIPYFNKYLSDRGLSPVIERDVNDNTERNKKSPSKIVTLRENSRYKGNAIGNAQNLLIRNILSNLGDESFNENDWIETKKYFGDKCAYCDNSTEELVMEHAIPINKEKLGEHRIGNLVPACNKCNKNKGDKDYREFLGENINAIRKIDEYMESKNYTPLEDDNYIKALLKIAYEEVSIIADRYIKILNFEQQQIKTEEKND